MELSPDSLLAKAINAARDTDKKCKEAWAEVNDDGMVPPEIAVQMAIVGFSLKGIFDAIFEALDELSQYAASKGGIKKGTLKVGDAERVMESFQALLKSIMSNAYVYGLMVGSGKWKKPEVDSLLEFLGVAEEDLQEEHKPAQFGNEVGWIFDPHN